MIPATRLAALGGAVSPDQALQWDRLGYARDDVG